MSSAAVAVRTSGRALRAPHPASGTPFEALSASLRVFRRLVAEQLEAEHIAVTDFWALNGIVGGTTSPTALGRQLAVTPAGMTQLLDRLEQRGFIARVPSRDDRRSTVLTVTPKGREIQRRAFTRCAQFLNEITAELSPAGLHSLQVLARELGAIVARRTGDPAQGE